MAKMTNILLFLVIILTCLLFVIIYKKYFQNSDGPETFWTGSMVNAQYYPGTVWPVTQAGYTNFPFWNTQLGSKRNMSYDLRGDVPIRRQYTGPWLQASQTPIYNRPLTLGYSL